MGWPSWMFICLALSFSFFFVFLHYEQKLMDHGGTPLINLQLLKDRAFMTGLLIVSAFFSGNAATFFIMAFYLQKSLQFTALEAAFAYTPLGIGFLGGSLIVPKIIGRLGMNVLRVGTGLMVIGVGIMMATVYYITKLTWQHLIPAMLVSGIGQGLVATPLVRTILSQIKMKETGTASGILSTVTVISQGTGVSLIGTLYFAVMKSDYASLSVSTHSFMISLLCILCLAIITGLLLFLLPGKPKKV